MNANSIFSRGNLTLAQMKRSILSEILESLVPFLGVIPINKMRNIWQCHRGRIAASHWNSYFLQPNFQFFSHCYSILNLLYLKKEIVGNWEWRELAKKEKKRKELQFPFKKRNYSSLLTILALQFLIFWVARPNTNNCLGRSSIRNEWLNPLNSIKGLQDHKRGELKGLVVTFCHFSASPQILGI